MTSSTSATHATDHALVDAVPSAENTLTFRRLDDLLPVLIGELPRVPACALPVLRVVSASPEGQVRQLEARWVVTEVPQKETGRTWTVLQFPCDDVRTATHSGRHLDHPVTLTVAGSGILQASGRGSDPASVEPISQRFANTSHPLTIAGGTPWV